MSAAAATPAAAVAAAAAAAAQRVSLSLGLHPRSAWRNLRSSGSQRLQHSTATTRV